MINEEKIEQCVNEYLETHQKEIKDIVFKKTETAIKKVINEAFAYGTWDDREGFAIQIIRGQVNPVIDATTKELKVDKEDIINKADKEINRQVNNYLRRLDVKIGKKM